MKKFFDSIYVRVLLGILIVAVGYFSAALFEKRETVPLTPETAVVPTTVIETKVVTLRVDEIGIREPFTEGETVYDLLRSVEEKGEIQFSGTDYPQMGFFVRSIGSIHEGGGKYVMYFINGQEASVGVSSFVPHDGDVIEFKLK